MASLGTDNKRDLANISVIGDSDVQRDSLDITQAFYLDHPNETYREYGDLLAQSRAITDVVKRSREIIGEIEKIEYLETMEEQIEMLSNIKAKYNLDLNLSTDSIRSDEYLNLEKGGKDVRSIIESAIELRSTIIKMNNSAFQNIKLIDYHVRSVEGFYVDPNLLNNITSNLIALNSIEPSVIINFDIFSGTEDQAGLLLETISRIREDFSQFGAIVQIDNSSDIDLKNIGIDISNIGDLDDFITGIYSTVEVKYDISEYFESLTDLQDIQLFKGNLLVELAKSGFIGGTFDSGLLYLTYIPFYETDLDGKTKPFSDWFSNLQLVIESYQLASNNTGSMEFGKKIVINYFEDISQRNKIVRDKSISREIVKRIVDYLEKG